MIQSKQSQKAGDGSVLIQVEHLITGIDEKRAREIYDEKYNLAKQELTEEALEIANARVKELENRLIPKMMMIDRKLSAFADPSFQLLLIEAQKAAAATERIPDYDLLSELLINRIQKGEDRNTRAGISRAIEIVEDISDDALLGLTVAHSVSFFIPVTGSINQGLDVLNNLFEKIIYGALPQSNTWLDHLDILNAVRLKSLVEIKKIQEYYSELLNGYVAVGIKQNSENYNKAIEILKTVELSPSCLVEHELNPGYMRIPVSNKIQIDTLTIDVTSILKGITHVTTMPINTCQKEALVSVFELYEEENDLKKQNIQRFMEEWDKRSTLKILRLWWDNLPGFYITSIGKVLAHANAQRCDKNLPSFN